MRVMASTDELDKCLDRVLTIFRSNAAYLFPKTLGRFESRKSPATTTYSLAARKGLGELANELLEFLETLGDFPEYKDRNLNKKINMLWKVIYSFDTQLDSTSASDVEQQRLHLHHISPRLANCLEEIASSVASFTQNGQSYDCIAGVDI